MDETITITFTVDGVDHVRTLDPSFIKSYPQCSFVLCYQELARDNDLVRKTSMKGEESGLSLEEFDLMMSAINTRTIFQQSEEVINLLDRHGLMGYSLKIRDGMLKDLNDRVEKLHQFEVNNEPMFFCESVQDYKRAKEWLKFSERIFPIQIMILDACPILISIDDA
ncbi:Hypothetical protein POVR1_LOCUS235 [uncultured virus]|nr:Hypothetical protein POVR1_LOCUS235 [uncultured virus]